MGVRGLCDRHGILLIADEVMSGFGRTGRWFAVEHWDIVPDMMTLAKGLTSGYAPLGAVAMKTEIAEFFNETSLPGWAYLQRAPDIIGSGGRQHPGTERRSPYRESSQDGA